MSIRYTVVTPARTFFSLIPFVEYSNDGGVVVVVVVVVDVSVVVDVVAVDVNVVIIVVDVIVIVVDVIDAFGLTVSLGDAFVDVG